VKIELPKEEIKVHGFLDLFMKQLM